MGDTVTLTAKDAEKVLQWENASGKTLGTSGTLTFTVSGNTTLRLVYKKDGEERAYVQFVSDYGQVLEAGLYASGDAIKFPDIKPSKTGFDFVKWVIENTTFEATGENIKAQFGLTKTVTVKPTYKQIEKSYTTTVITVYGNSEIDAVTYENKIGEGRTLTVPDTIYDKEFKYWKDENDRIISYSKTYYLLVTKNATLKAYYGDAVTAVPVITISGVTAKTDNGAHKVTARVYRSIPDGYTLIEHGVLYAKGVSGLNETNFVYGTEGVSKFVSSKAGNDGTVTLNVTPQHDNTNVYFRGYMIVSDGTTVTTYYTDIVYDNYSHAYYNP